MPFYDPKKHDRQSIRLKGYDYSSPGEYFLTLCLQNRACLFGDIKEAQMILNSSGRMTDFWWNKIPEKFFNARLDVYQIMPNHFHGIIGILDSADPRIHNQNVGVDPRVNPNKEDSHNRGGHTGPPQPGPPQPGPPQPGPPQRDQDSKNAGTNPRINPKEDKPKPEFEIRPASIPAIVQWFKTMTTNKYIVNVKAGRFPRFDGKLWQRNYYDHIIRDEKSLKRIQNYIIDNPRKWEEDRDNPNNF